MAKSRGARYGAVAVVQQHADDVLADVRDHDVQRIVAVEIGDRRFRGSFDGGEEKGRLVGRVELVDVRQLEGKMSRGRVTRRNSHEQLLSRVDHQGRHGRSGRAAC